MAEALAQLAEEKSKIKNRKLLTPADYRSIIDMTKQQAERVSYEDAFEKVIEQKIQNNFPRSYEEIYSQQAVRSQ